METRIGGELYHLYGPRSSDLSDLGPRNVEWNISDWRWDGDLFLASPLNSASTDCRSRQFFPAQVNVNSSSCSDEVQVGNGWRDVDKRRKLSLVEDGQLNGEPGSLTLKLGGHGYSEREQGYSEEINGRKSKMGSSTTNRAVCQVEDCGSDLGNAKDYHRRHKVCEMHSKASKALVGNILQRFCQQCSRFHALQEFDEGKRSCRRRLAGHNKRRRKTQPETVVDGSSIKDDHASGYILVTLLKLLSNIHSDRMDPTKEQDVISHLLRSLLPQNSKSDGVSGHNGDILSDLLSKYPQLKPNEQSHNPSQDKHAQVPPEDDSRVRAGHFASQAMTPFRMQCDLPVAAEAQDCSVEKRNNFDLNDTYSDLDACIEDGQRFPADKNTEVPFNYPLSTLQDSNFSSPPQTSGRSDSVSTHSPSTSSGDGQSRTDRIVFKLFGKEPADFPVILRTQILDWLSHSPTDIESYIRPGCVILTIYVRMSKTMWEEICSCLGSSLGRLVSIYDTFWGTGWVYVRVQNQVAFIYNGRVVLDTMIPFSLLNHTEIISIKPIAVSASERAKFTIKSLSLLRPETRLLCAVEGEYLSPDLTDYPSGHANRQHLSFSCLPPVHTGRGFIEIEDTVLGSSFFPFIVADEDVCSEIRMLENVFDLNGSNEAVRRLDGRLCLKNQAMDFVHEMGWLLHRCHFRSCLSNLNPCTFSLKRFIYLIEFAVDHDWCAVVRKLLDILLDGIVGFGEHGSVAVALSEMNLLHRAVRRNCRPLVELLLKYDLGKKVNNLSNADRIDGMPEGLFFKPDVAGPSGLTPLHIAAGRDNAADIVDALTDDPGLVGVKAWKHTKDTTGCTPEDYARLRGHFSYIHLVQRKTSKPPRDGHVVVDMPAVYAGGNAKQGNGCVSSLEIGKVGPELPRGPCQLCSRKLATRASSKPLVYRPAMLSLVAIAAVCVCVALLMKSLPEVLYVFRPFRWELLQYGSS